jgi:hexosaminidase
MLAWLEYPLTAAHLDLIPAGVIDGVVGEEDYMPIEKQRGMRQLSYTSMQGSELLFPNILSIDGVTPGHLDAARRTIASGRASLLDPIGVFGAAWDDSGLHNETFWLGWSGVAQWGWNPDAASVEQHTAEFMRLYYGAGVPEMGDIYRTLQRQARAWENSWDRVTSRARPPGYGNSYGKGIGTQRYDLTLAPPLPRLPDEKTSVTFREKHARLLGETRPRAEENERLVYTLTAALARVERNRYNVEVLQVLARFIGHHWRLLLGLADAEEMLQAAQTDTSRDKPADAVGRMLAAHDRVQALEREGRQVFSELTLVFEKSRFPKGRSVGGRAYLHILDDTKDHWADRRPDLSYMFAPEESMGLPQWRQRLLDQIETYAKLHNVPLKALLERRLEQ